MYVALTKDREEVRVVGRQLLRFGTSVDAHSREASRARSDAEFVSKIEGPTQEADESALWIELLLEDCKIRAAGIEHTLNETYELIAIFSAIAKKVKDSKQN